MPIDLNREPYWDDFDESKNFYRVLFRPGVAVQTRELNQLQTIIQKQVEKFGNHIFREGTIVLGGQFDVQKNVDSIKLDISEVENFEEIDFKSFNGKFIEGKFSGLRAYIVDSIFDNENNVQVLMIRYLNSNEFDETVFRAQEPIIFKTESTDPGEFEPTGLEIPVVDEGDSRANKGIVFSIDEGVVFVKGYFVSFPKLSVVLSPYTTRPNISVGFKSDDLTIANSISDPSLLDNSRGTFNFAAPGADRLVLSLRLVTRPLLEDGITIDPTVEEDDFSLLASFRTGKLIKSKERTEYERIYEELAKRTFDESGDYYVKGLTVRTREAFDSGLNEGLSEEGDPDQLSIDVEPGLAFVKGFEINKLATTHVLTNKAKDFKFINNAVINARTGGYILINEVVGSLTIDEAETIDLIDTAENRITNETSLTAAVSPGSVIGTAKVKSVLYESGAMGTPGGTLRLYLFDINMAPGNVISDAKAVSKPGKIFADIVSEDLLGTLENKLIYPIGTTHTRKIRKQTDQETSTDTNFVFYKTKNDAFIGQGTDQISFSSPVPLAYGSGALSSLEKQTIFVSLNNASGPFLAGHHFDMSSSDVTVQVFGTNQIQINLGTTFASNTSVSVSYKARLPEAFESPKTLIPNVYVKVDFDAANAPSLNGPIPLGVADLYRVHEIRRLTNQDFTQPTDGENVTFLFDVDRGGRDNFYDHATITPRAINLTSDDRLLIKLSYFSSTRHSYFSVDSYPIDDVQASPSTLFTYEIPSYVSSNGTVFNLKDCLDFRPVKSPTATPTQSVSAAPINPVFGQEFIESQETDKLLIPVPSSSIQIDYSFYLSRRDVLTLNKDGEFAIVKGVASTTPITPKVSENVMPIANIFIPPFPSISQSFARIIGLKEHVTHQRVANKRFTMRDIGVLRDRIENLEYYNALSLIEKETSDMLILDENGLNRFKNGFFADGFIDHSLGATTNPDYNISVDRVEKVIRPVYEMQSFTFDADSLGELEKYESGNLLHIPIKEEIVLVNQPFATTIRNVEQSVYRFVGDLQLVPDNDTWVDENTFDRSVDFGSDIPDIIRERSVVESQASGTATAIGTTQASARSTGIGTFNGSVINTEYGGWERHILGYDVSRQAGGWTGLRFVDGTKNSTAQHLGKFTSYAEAQKIARSQAAYNGWGDGTNSQGVVETITQDRRTIERTGFDVDGRITTAVDAGFNLIGQVDTETDVDIRTGLNLNVGFEKETQQLGDFVTDVSLIPYVRPQTIRFYATGLKPNTRHWVFFDGEDVTKYVRQYDPEVSQGTFATNTTPDQRGKFKGIENFPPLSSEFLLEEGTILRTDDFGEIKAALTLPEGGKQFRVGSKDFKILDNPTINIDNITSFAEDYFLASGLNVTKQRTILSTKIPTTFGIDLDQDVDVTSRARLGLDADLTLDVDVDAEIDFDPIQESFQEQRKIRVDDTKVIGPTCIAYTFRVEVPNGIEGTFLTSVGLFFAELDPNLGFRVHIRELNSAGNITRNHLPYSEVWVRRNDSRINISDDGQLETKIEFEAPVFVYNNTSYAVVISAENVNPNTFVWVSKLGEINIADGVPVTSRPHTGAVFTTNNGVNWDIVPQLDMKLKLYRAKFEAFKNYSSIIRNNPYEIFKLTGTTARFNVFGEEIVGSEKLTLSFSSGSAVAGNTIQSQETTGLSGEVVFVDGPIIGTDTIGFQNGETVKIFDGASEVGTAVITNVQQGRAFLQKYIPETDKIYLEESNGAFFEGAKIIGLVTQTESTIDQYDGFKYSTTTIKPDILDFNDTEINLRKRGRASSGGFGFVPYIDGAPDGTSSFNEELIILPRSQEVELFGNSGYSSNVEVTMKTNTEFLSPVLDVSRAHGVYVYNLINADITGETNPSGGDLINKYISKTITLDDGQDAEDLLVYLTAYRPPSLVSDENDIKVWMKIRHKEDPEPFNEKPWYEMVKNNDNFSSIENEFNFIGIKFSTPEELLNDGIIEYEVDVDGTPVTLSSYKQYAIKIGILGGNSALVPKVADLRAIALQK